MRYVVPKLAYLSPNIALYSIPGHWAAELPSRALKHDKLVRVTASSKVKQSRC